jgi:hypothetical protein
MKAANKPRRGSNIIKMIDEDNGIEKSIIHIRISLIKKCQLFWVLGGFAALREEQSFLIHAAADVPGAFADEGVDFSAFLAHEPHHAF